MKTDETITMKEKHDEMLASEALYAFAAWLTSLEKPVTFSARHNASPAAEMIAEFCIENKLENPRPGWEDGFSWPKTRELWSGNDEVESEIVKG